jgi:hypothetical protein
VVGDVGGLGLSEYEAVTWQHTCPELRHCDLILMQGWVTEVGASGGGSCTARDNVVVHVGGWGKCEGLKVTLLSLCLTVSCCQGPKTEQGH